MNNKKLLIIPFLIFQIGSLISQINYGVKVGVGIAVPHFKQSSSIIENELIEFKEVTGPTPSLSTNFIFSSDRTKTIALSIEPGFVTKGYRSTTVDSRLTYYYIHLPIALSIRIHKNIRIEPTYEVGTILAAVRYNSGQRGNLKKLGLYQNIIEHSIGGTLRYQLKSYLDIGIKYSRGLNDLSEVFYTDINGFEIGNINERAQYLNLSVAYYFTSSKEE